MNRLKLLLITCLFASFANSIYAFSANKTFLSKCSSCHTVGKGDKVGPDLEGVTKRRKKEWIYKFIPSPKAMIDSGDKTANELHKKYKDLMPDQELTKVEIDAILKLIESGGPKFIKKKLFVREKTDTNSFVKKYFFIATLIAVLFLGVFAFKTGRKSLMYASFIFFTVGAIVGSIWEARKVGLTEGYGPKQPINYSHLVHAGENKIQCLYCHFGARKGRTAGIPPAELCLNCHEHIKTKIVKKAVKAKNGKPARPEVREDSDEIVAIRKALKDNKPIEWVRVNLLPDHVYFNHAQHVEVADIDCQSCHGNAETYEVMYQTFSLSMGWCLDCHRRKGIAPPEDKNSKAGGDCKKCHY